MSIADFDKLIEEIKLEVKEGNVNAVLENIIKVAGVAQSTNKKGLQCLETSIRFKKV